MQFNEAPWRIKDKHAVLAPSNYSWLNYDDDHMIRRLRTMEAAAFGTRQHNFASQAIELGVKLEGDKTTLAKYVRAAIGYKMTPEQMLYWSDNCFGTADAIGFRKERGDDKFTLRIFDLKTGETKVKVDQLLIYGALFCLEYDFKPHDLNYDFRIYQSDDVQEFDVDPKDIVRIMDHIVHLDKLINKAREDKIV